MGRRWICILRSFGLGRLVCEADPFELLERCRLTLGYSYFHGSGELVHDSDVAGFDESWEVGYERDDYTW